MACGRGSACDLCSEKAVTRMDWLSWSGYYCPQHAAFLLRETEAPEDLSFTPVTWASQEPTE